MTTESSFQMEAEKLELWTKQGQRQLVLSYLKDLEIKSFSDQELTTLANFANRNHAPLLAMRLLHKVILKFREENKPILDQALVVYANSLTTIGSLEEAKIYLKKPNSRPESLLAKAFISFAEWNYRAAIPHIERYIKQPGLTDYQRKVGLINLVAGLTSLGRLSSAQLHIDKLQIELSGSETFKVLYANLQELQAQVHLQNHRIPEAKESLLKAQDLLKSHAGRYLLYVNKWLAVIDLMEQDPLNLNPQRLIEVRLQALGLRNWETIRDCDFHMARLTHDNSLLARVFWGTPYPNYRKRMIELYQVKTPELPMFRFSPNNQLKEPDTIHFDLSDPQSIFRKQDRFYRLFKILVHDIYRPPRMGVVFSRLYPDEYFDPFHSPHRVRSLVSRFNHFSKTNHFLFNVKIEKGDFILVSEVPRAGILLHPTKPITSVHRLPFDIIKKQLKGKRLTSPLIANTLGVSQRSVTKLIQSWLESKLIIKKGRGRSTYYHFLR